MRMYTGVVVAQWCVVTQGGGGSGPAYYTTSQLVRTAYHVGTERECRPGVPKPCAPCACVHCVRVHCVRARAWSRVCIRASALLRAKSCAPETAMARHVRPFVRNGLDIKAVFGDEDPSGFVVGVHIPSDDHCHHVVAHEHASKE